MNLGWSGLGQGHKRGWGLGRRCRLRQKPWGTDGGKQRVGRD